MADELPSVYEIESGLYIGSLRSLGQLQALTISHVLSVVNFEVTKDLTGYQHLHVHLRDDEGANLLVHLPSTFTFLRDALAEGGKVLVHCQAGISRSVAVVAAYLMKSQSLTPEQALELIQSKCPDANPNEGFMAQLGLFHDMKCSLDQEHPVYRMWCLEQVGKLWKEEGWVDPDTFAQLPEEGKGQPQDTVYRCRKCRRLLLTSRNVVPVDAAMGHKMFIDRKSVKGKVVQRQSDTSGGEESSMFAEPMSWMADNVVGVVQGKLYCPGCSARLGSFNWAGITNEKGAWVTPGFQIHASKLDAVVHRPTGAMRRPFILPSAAAQSQSQSTAAAPGSAQAGPAAAQGSLASAPSTAGAAPSQPAQDAQEASTPGGAAAHSANTTDNSSSSTSALPSGFTHLVFDCDGVLVDTERASCESLRLAILEVTSFDIPHNFPTDYNEVFGMDVRSCVEHYKAKFSREGWEDVVDISNKVQAAKEGIYKRLTAEGIQAFSGAAALIRQAQQLGLPIGVGSSGAPEKIHHNLTSSGLAPLLDQRFIVSAQHVGRGKPAPDVYLEVLRRLGCTQPSKAIIIEDAVNGLKAARTSGAFTVAVTTSLPRSHLEPYADLVVDRLEELDLVALTSKVA